jgi:hypothetical protein
MPKFRAGDMVFHRPTQEKWVLAYAEGSFVAPCGWPDCQAKASDCDLVRAATDAEHRDMLESWARKCEWKGENDRRHHACKRQLFMLNEGFVGAGI